MLQNSAEKNKATSCPEKGWLEECGAQEVLKKTDDGYAVRMSLIELRG